MDGVPNVTVNINTTNVSCFNIGCTQSTNTHELLIEPKKLRKVSDAHTPKFSNSRLDLNKEVKLSDHIEVKCKQVNGTGCY